MEPILRENQVHAWLKKLVPELASRVQPAHPPNPFSKPAIRVVGQLFVDQIKNLDPSPKTAVHIEGQPGRLIGKKRKFLGSACYPDLWLRCGGKDVAIEIDHGWVGSHVRNALTKASFNVAVGDWQECYVLFFDETGGILARAAEGKAETRILSEFHKRFSTQVIFIPFHKG